MLVRNSGQGGLKEEGGTKKEELVGIALNLHFSPVFLLLCLPSPAFFFHPWPATCLPGCGKQIAMNSVAYFSLTREIEKSMPRPKPGRYLLASSRVPVVGVVERRKRGQVLASSRVPNVGKQELEQGEKRSSYGMELTFAAPSP